MYSGSSKIDRTDLYKANRRFNMYRRHISDPVYFENDLRVTIQALGWRSDGRYLPLQDDISSVCYRYSDRKESGFPPVADKDALEIT